MKKAEDYLEEGRKYFYKQGKYKEAQRFLIQASKMKPKFSEAYRELAIIEQMLGNHKKALKLIMKSIELTPDNPIALYYKWTILAGDNLSKQDKESEKAFYEAEALIEKPLSKDNSAIYIAKTYYLAVKYKLEKDIKKKSHYKKQAIKYCNMQNEEDIYFEYSLFIKIFISLNYDKEDDWKDKLIWVDKILSKKDNEEWPKIHDYNAQILHKLKRTEDAIKSYDKAIELYKKDEYYNDALSCYNKMIKIDQSQSRFFFGRAQIFQLLGKFHHAIQDLDEALKLAPKNKEITSFRKDVMDFYLIHHGDDSSDEDNESIIYKNKTLLDFKFDRKDEMLIKTLPHPYWSLIMQELGTRLLISSPVRNLYFPAKYKIGEFEKLPNEEDIKGVFINIVQDLSSNGDEIIKTKVFKEQLKSIISDKRSLFLSSKDTMKKLETNLKEIFKLILPKKMGSPAQAVYKRQIETIIKNMGKIITKKSDKISCESSIVTKTQNLLTAESSDISKIIQSVLKDNVISRWQTITIDELKTLSLNTIISNRKGGNITEDDFISEVKNKIQIIKDGLLRPVLQDSTCMSSKDFNNHEYYTGPAMIFANIRLSHLSAKRYIKNQKHKIFEGVIFSRAWQFDHEKQLSLIEKQELSGKNKAITSLVYYPYDSSYEKLLSKLRQFQDKKFSDPDIAKKGIVSILQTGAIDSSFNISADFEHFLMIFTYHLFHTEIQRHPSAAIHNVIGLDLVIKHKYSIEYIFTSLPMTIKGAMSVVRTLQTNLQTKLSIPYFYDKASSDNLVSEISSSEFEDFIEKENDLISKLITKYKLKDKPIQLIVGKIDELCEEYYGIKLCGEDIDMTLDYNICT